MTNVERQRQHDDWEITSGDAEREHGKALQKTGFWGKQGAGAIIMAKTTGRILLSFRSLLVLQPNTWGVWGGAIDPSENPKTAAEREVKEEVGYRGSDIKMVPLYVFEDSKSGFKYHNFLAVVSDEFIPNLNWETENFRWVEFGDWPTPLHFGLKALIQHSGNDIKKIIEKNKLNKGITESDGNPFIVRRGFAFRK
jgi:8-oxo-dGTP pyrophosphatase MutT (NUDIX family)